MDDLLELDEQVLTFDIPDEGLRPTLRDSNFRAKLNPMEYRGIRYTIRAGIDGRWLVVIHPDGIEVPSRQVWGTREGAEVHAHRMIDRWLQPKSRHRNEQMKE